MHATFKITVEPTRDLVRLVLGGFFTTVDVARFLDARNAGHRSLTCPPNQHLTLADVREMRIQPQDSVAAFGALLADPTHQSRRLALVFASSLARQQLARAAESRRVRFFTDMAEAEAWLFGPKEAEDAAAA